MNDDFNPTMTGIKPYRVVKASELGIKGTILEVEIRNEKCIICGMLADRVVWIYTKEGVEEKDNKMKTKMPACSEECAEFVIMRN